MAWTMDERKDLREPEPTENSRDEQRGNNVEEDSEETPSAKLDPGKPKRMQVMVSNLLGSIFP